MNQLRFNFYCFFFKVSKCQLYYPIISCQGIPSYLLSYPIFFLLFYLVPTVRSGTILLNIQFQQCSNHFYPFLRCQKKSFPKSKRFVLFQNICYVLFNSIQSFYILFYNVLSCSIQFYSVLFCSILFYPVLSCSILFYSVLFVSILFYFLLSCFFLFYAVKFCSILLCPVLSYLILFYPALFCSILSILFYPVLFFSIQFYLFLS